MVFTEGRVFGLLMLTALSIIGLYLGSIVDKWSPKIRQIAGVLAIPELIGRAVELGRPVHTCTGRGGNLSRTEVSSMIMAGLSVFSYTAGLCASRGAELIVSVGQTDTIPILEEYVRDAYRAEGQPVPNLDETIRFHSQNQFAFQSAVTGIMRRERPAANIVVGPIWAESSQLVNSAAQVGAMQLVGTARLSHMPFFAILADFVLIGEEIYAAGAVLGGDQVTINTLASQDVGKLIAIILIILGSILAMAGNNMLSNILGM